MRLLHGCEALSRVPPLLGVLVVIGPERRVEGLGHRASGRPRLLQKIARWAGWQRMQAAGPRAELGRLGPLLLSQQAFSALNCFGLVTEPPYHDGAYAVLVLVNRCESVLALAPVLEFLQPRCNLGFRLPAPRTALHPKVVHPLRLQGGLVLGSSCQKRRQVPRIRLLGHHVIHEVEDQMPLLVV